VFKKQILKRGQKESDWSCAGLDEIARICVAEGAIGRCTLGGGGAGGAYLHGEGPLASAR
jgi:hypothetical protein